MKDQHTQITGYRDLTQDEIDLMNAIKAMGIQLDTLCKQVGEAPNVDKRWLSIGITDLQKGLMAVTRAVARPTTF